MNYTDVYFSQAYSRIGIVLFDAPQPSMEQDNDSSVKRKRLTGDERLQQNRERNRMHARKTRERKKQQTVALQSRISELQAEIGHLREMVDERYTASALLGLCQTSETIDDSTFVIGGSDNKPPAVEAPRESKEGIILQSSASLCGTGLSAALAEYQILGEPSLADSVNGQQTTKRVRRRGKYTPQERDRIRRERNRMHAKKTRDRKKLFLEASEHVISEMENEARRLRDYLVSLKLMSVEEAGKSDERDAQSRKELAHLKLCQSEFDQDDNDDYNSPQASPKSGDGSRTTSSNPSGSGKSSGARAYYDEEEEDEDGEECQDGDDYGDDERENEGSISGSVGSDDNDKNWSGSNTSSESAREQSTSALSTSDSFTSPRGSSVGGSKSGNTSGDGGSGGSSDGCRERGGESGEGVSSKDSGSGGEGDSEEGDSPGTVADDGGSDCAGYVEKN